MEKGNKHIVSEILRMKKGLLREIEVLNNCVIDCEKVIKLFTPITPEQAIRDLINEYPRKTWQSFEFKSHLIFMAKLRGLKPKRINLNYTVPNIIKKLIASKIIEENRKDIYRIPVKESKNARFIRLHKEKGLCIRCCEPATLTLLCDGHRKKKREQSRPKPPEEVKPK